MELEVHDAPLLTIGPSVDSLNLALARPHKQFENPNITNYVDHEYRPNCVAQLL